MTKPPIHVLHSFGSLNQGGIETWLINIVRECSPELKFDFVLETPDGYYEEEAKRHGCRIYYLPVRSRLQKRLQIMGLGRKSSSLTDLLKANRYDVFHIHGEEFMGDAVKEAAQAGVPVRVAHCHASRLARGRKSLEMAVRSVRFRTLDRSRISSYATDILACSNDAGIFLMGRKWETDARCKALYCGIPLHDYRRAMVQSTRSEFRRSKGIPEDAIVVGHVGSMGPTPVKNHFFLLKVFRELAMRDLRYHLFLAGDGPLRKGIQAAASEYGLEGRVHMPGQCNDVPGLMVHAFDAMLFPSLMEGLGLVIVEAMAGGAHTVCSDVIPPEITKDLAQMVTTLPLAAPVETWADKVEEAVSRRIAPVEGIGIVMNSRFSLSTSMENLIRSYRSRLENSRVEVSR